MEGRIGTVLRETRKRRQIELLEVEETTRIRARYLRAIELEEWDVLPGGVYTRSFIRTYASFLGLDGERLADDFRESVEGAGRGPPADFVAKASSASGKRGRSIPRPGWIAVPAVILIGALAVVALPSQDGGGEGTLQKPSGHSGENAPGKPQPATVGAPSRGVSVRFAASAEVWVCVLGAGGQHLVNGEILAAGATAGPFHSDSFTVSFGNGEVSMLIDGKEAAIPATSSPIGYSIDASGRLTELGETERPTCA